ncbi:MAG: hypothetical protein AAF404_05720 [Pseudomonadota bacterium]
MNDIKRDQRTIGGPRVASSFKLAVKNPDPFSVHKDSFAGIIVFNVRGGCLFIENAELSQAQKRIFSEGPVALLSSLDLETADGQRCSLRKIKIKLSREKDLEDLHGIVFKFVQTSEDQMELLNVLTEKLPHIDSDNEILVPPYRKAG